MVSSMKDYRKLVYRYIWKNKCRTILTIFSIAMGVGALSVLLHVADIYFQDKIIKSLMANSELLRPSYETVTSVYYCFILLIAYIFALLCVGVVRNTLSLIILEQIKDFQMMRCIGATGKQLRGIVYLCGLFLEGIGFLLGYASGFPVTLYICEKLKLDYSFTIWVIGVIALAFFGDLFFAVHDITKMVMKMTPADAVRGEYKLGKDILKASGKGIWGRIFGVEGEYAWKNLKRNPKRFRAMVFAISFAVATVIISIGVESNLNYYFYQYADFIGGRYQVIIGGSPQIGLYPSELNDFKGEDAEECVERLENSAYVTMKKAYAVKVLQSDYDEMLSHIAKEGAEADWVEDITRYWNRFLTREEILDELTGEELVEKERLYGRLLEYILGKEVWGYDTEDYKALTPYLLEGTLELSDHGILAVNGLRMLDYGEDSMTMVCLEKEEGNYHVGDTVTIVDHTELTKKTHKRMATVRKGGQLAEEVSEQYIVEAYEECVKQGQFKTYVVEGVLSQDETGPGILFPYGYTATPFILPLDRFFEEFHYSEEMNCGYMFHIKGHKMDENLRYVARSLDNWSDYEDYEDYFYLSLLYGMRQTQIVLSAILAFIVFIVLMQLLNVFNSTSSNLYLRRKEFAQLRVIGMSRKHLRRMVMLEGVIISLCATVIGSIFSLGVYVLMYNLLTIGFSVNLRFPWEGVLLSGVGAMVLLCGIIALGVRGRNGNNLEDLSGEGW